MDSKLSAAMGCVVNALNNDSDYRIGWVANIAMAYKDCERWYKEKHDKKRLTSKDRHLIANESAEYFIKNLCS